jgi:hypothetical protein
MRNLPAAPKQPGTDGVIRWTFLVIEYAIVASLLVLGGVVLVRTMAAFFHRWSSFPQTVVVAIDGILVVIIILDVAHTVFGHIRASTFPVRPFLVVGILAGVRDVLSASAHLALSEHLTGQDFHDTLIQLAVGVGVVIVLLFGLYLLKLSGGDPEDEAT